MSKEIKISQLKNWGRPKKTKETPAFLLPKEEREKILRSKTRVRGNPGKP
ncbi:MAG: hypothetical protein JSV05_02085 [Candidatus Bathyarchaeota archaeon]|nr:MAG: hypothetical protein JSV05_02085 [Candidatus Bathyarchaeota archaeon]